MEHLCNNINKEKTEHSVPGPRFSITDLTWTDPKPNRGLRRKRTVPEHLSHSTACLKPKILKINPRYAYEPVHTTQQRVSNFVINTCQITLCKEMITLCPERTQKLCRWNVEFFHVKLCGTQANH